MSVSPAGLAALDVTPRPVALEREEPCPARREEVPPALLAPVFLGAPANVPQRLALVSCLPAINAYSVSPVGGISGVGVARVVCSARVTDHVDHWQWSDLHGGVLQRGRGTDVAPIPLKVRLAVTGDSAAINKVIGKINDKCGYCWASLDTTGKGVPGQRIATDCYSAVLDVTPEPNVKVVMVGTSGCVAAGDTTSRRQ